MNSENNSNCTPRLRFPGFTGEWEEKKLGEVANKVNRRNRHLEVSRVLTNSANEGVVDQNDYFDRDIAVKDNTANYHIVELDDFVYNPRISTAAPVGPISINKVGRGIMSPLYTIFKFHTGSVSFYEQYFQTTIWHPYLKSIANFGARFDRMNITSEGFFNMPLFLPSPAEQEKIAGCLSAVDALIAAQRQKVEVLKERKRGLMQQLFPQPGETTPRLRFSSFEGDWVKKKLGDVLVERKESSIITEELPQLSFTIADGLIWPEDRKSNQRDFLMKDKDNKKFSVTRLHDIIYNPANVVHGAIHKNNLSDGVVSPIYKIFWTYENADFFNYLLKRPSFISLLASRAEGTVTKLKTLKTEAFLDMSITFPINMSEQNIIAGCFMTLDRLIKDESLKLDILKVHKRGLMQQLFPQPSK